MQDFIGVYWDEQDIYCFVKIKAKDYDDAEKKLEEYLERLEYEGLFFAINREIDFWNSIENIE
jgi:hypothetical protein